MEWCVPENDDDDESGSALNTDDLQKVRNNTILSIFGQIIRFIFIFLQQKETSNGTQPCLLLLKRFHNFSVSFYFSGHLLKEKTKKGGFKKVIKKGVAIGSLMSLGNLGLF